MYTPISLSVYTAAFAGAMAGMGSSERVLTSKNPTAYSKLAASAGAWAQQFDTTWAGAVASSYTIDVVEEMSESSWAGRTPTSSTPITYKNQIDALIAAIQAGGTYLSAQGVTPQSVSAQDVVFRPGAPSSGRFVETWEEVQSVIAAASGLMTVYMDNSFDALIIPTESGVTDFRSLVVLSALPGREAVSVGLEDGATFLSPVGFDNIRATFTNIVEGTGLNFSYTGGTPYTGGDTFFFLRGNSDLTPSIVAACVIPDGETLNVTLNSQTDGIPGPASITGGSPFFKLVANASLNINAIGPSFLEDSFVESAVASFLSISYDAQFRAHTTFPFPVLPTALGNVTYVGPTALLSGSSVFTGGGLYAAKPGEIVSVDCNPGSVTVNLPNVANGSLIVVKATQLGGGEDITVVPGGGHTVEGGATDVINPLADKICRHYMLVGTNWEIIASYP